MYAYFVVCYKVIAALYIGNVGYVFAHLYTLVGDLECPLDNNDLSYHPKLCDPCVNHQHIISNYDRAYHLYLLSTNHLINTVGVAQILTQKVVRL